MPKIPFVALPLLCIAVCFFLEEYDGELYTCCSASQITITSVQIKTLTTLLRNCPACMTNLRKNFCYFACHPRHSAFINPTSFLKNGNKYYPDFVFTLLYFILFENLFTSSFKRLLGKLALIV